MSSDNLETLRSKIAETDAKIMGLVSERLELAEKVGRHKIEKGLAIKAYDVEKNVIDRYRKIADGLGINEDLSDSLSKLLIDHACRIQEKNRLTNVKNDYIKHESPGNALIIGGAGNMGRWFTNFLGSFGYDVLVKDQHKSDKTLNYCDDSKSLNELVNGMDLIVIATPLSIVRETLEKLSKTKTKALIFDIASLKSPIIKTLIEAKKYLPNLVSIHPMFGPDVDLLDGENILICDMGNQEATFKAKNLFEKTAAKVTITSPEGHDELMSEILGLSHITNLLFGLTLTRSSLKVEELSTSKSTTFKHQLKVALGVANENPKLYFDIQKLNSYTPELYKRVLDSLKQIMKAVDQNDQTEFFNIMSKAKNILNDLSSKKLHPDR